MSEKKYLKFCPFCGCKTVLADPCTSRTRCPRCFASGPLISRFKTDDNTWEDATAAAWNTRAGDGGPYERSGENAES